MSLRFHDTPLAGRVAIPDPRLDAWRPGLEDALLPGGDAALARLGLPQALAVSTGQQPGLLGGPLLTAYKALSARALARILEERWRRPVVPVFWIAGDDHDYAEAATAAWLGLDGTMVSAVLPTRAPEAPLAPLYRERLPDEITGLLDHFESTLPLGENRDRTVTWLRAHYQPGRSLAAAGGGALAEILGRFGIAFLDGSNAALKRLAWPTLEKALEQSAAIDSRLLARSNALRAGGADPGVRVGDGASLVMLEAAAGRDRLLPGPNGFVTRRSGERLTRADLAQIAALEPERLSANVLLRPVVESALLPTVAYVAGPAELRYLDLARTVYEALGVAWQRPVPRWSGLIIEPRVSRALEKLDLTLDLALDPSGPADERLARRAAPSGFEADVLALRQALERGYNALIPRIKAIDPTLEKPALSARSAAQNGLAELERRVLAAIKRRHGETLGQLDRVRGALRPAGKPQERALGLAGFLARYGVGLLDDLASHIEHWYRRALEAPTASP